MRTVLLLVLLVSFLAIPVSASEFSPPTAPEVAMPYMPDKNDSFTEGLLFILKSGLSKIRPEITEASGICLSIILIALLLGFLSTISATPVIRFVGAVSIGLLILEPAGTMIRLGIDTVQQISEYGKLLLPVLTTAMAAQGFVTSSAAIHTGTIVFNTVLTALIRTILVPMLYCYLCFSLASSALGEDKLKRLRESVKWLMTWTLKWTLYIFGGYMSITGVISGTVDSYTLKAAKITVSGMVPVVGGMFADATETILVSAGMLKNTAGIYGIFVFLSLFIMPFIKIGLLYLLLKLTLSVVHIFGTKPMVELLQDITFGMGMLLAMTGTVCLLHLISIVCFMKGMGG